MRLEDLGLIGNCQFSALIEHTGSVVWCSMPRFDSEPVFGSLLDSTDGGELSVRPIGEEKGVQRYVPNTNVLETRFQTPEGSFRILDLAPRFVQYERSYRPTQLYRILQPLQGAPRVRVRCEPRSGWSKKRPARIYGSNHIEFEGFPTHVRLTSDIPISYLEGQPFVLSERKHLVFSWGAAVEEPLSPLCERMLGETVRYWQTWVKHCNVPPLFQEAVIRSALVLKLHCFEDTGAIVAAMTTSIPESPGSGRTWDYRYCWLRDAYYVLAALHLLGHFEERERFVTFLLNAAAGTPNLDLAPLYRVDGATDLEERTLANWPGYNGDGPVRVGNAAALQRQNDVFGEMMLALSPIFLDDRFRQEQSGSTLELLERIARKGIDVAGTPDAGIWELRTEPQPQTFSSAMCWAAADRMAKLAARHKPQHEQEFRASADRIRDEILANAWQGDLGSFVSTYHGRELDASLLQLVRLRLLPLSDVRLRATVDAIWKGLAREGWLFRYRGEDGFGRPTVAFTICTFWLVEALAATGRTEEAREVLVRSLAAISPLGLLSEDYEVSTLRMCGNFPQAYSHVGLIHAAFGASPSWSEFL